MEKKKITQRNQKIVKLHAEGKTQQEIADALGITRQRVQQIEFDLDIRRKREPNLGFQLVCQYSGKKFWTKNKSQKYASREYFYLARRKYKTQKEIEEQKERRRERNRAKASWYYHNVIKARPDFKELIRERNQKYATSTAN